MIFSYSLVVISTLRYCSFCSYFDIIEVEHDVDELTKGIERLLETKVGNNQFSFNVDTRNRFDELFEKEY